MDTALLKLVLAYIESKSPADLRALLFDVQRRYAGLYEMRSAPSSGNKHSWDRGYCSRCGIKETKKKTAGCQTATNFPSTTHAPSDMGTGTIVDLDP
jgi:hypothetical protein